MGACLSSADAQKPCANVVSINGELQQFPLPVTVDQVLQSLPSDSEYFICNSDSLYFEDYIPSLQPHHQLDHAQIYFVLPTAKLHYRLAASDMAALALKASLAIQKISTSTRRRNNYTRISLVLLSEEDPQSNHTVNYRIKTNDHGVNKPSSVSTSGSVRKLTRYSSQRAKLAVRSFKMKLSTIYEGSVLLPSF